MNLAVAAGRNQKEKIKKGKEDGKKDGAMPLGIALASSFWFGA